MPSNKNHPECGKDEVFVANADSDSLPKIRWLTKRKGSTAYGTEGKPLGERWPGAFPVFAKKDEIRKKDPKILERLEA